MVHVIGLHLLVDACMLTQISPIRCTLPLLTYAGLD